MTLPPYMRAYETWAPVVARVILGSLFLMGASYKIPGSESYAMEVGMTAAVGIPFAEIAVILALILEVGAGLALIVGYQTRRAAFLLALFTLLLSVLFYSNFADPMVMGQFMSHLGLVAGLLYVSVYGARSIAVKKD